MAQGSITFPTAHAEIELTREDLRTLRLQQHALLWQVRPQQPVSCLS